MTERNKENADIFRLRREGIATKVLTEHRDSETEDPNDIEQPFSISHRNLNHSTFSVLKTILIKLIWSCSQKFYL